MRLVATLIAVALASPSFASETAQPGGVNAEKEKLVCKREVPIGSLIATRKMCLTKTEWQKRQDDGNATARSLIEDGAGACGQEGGVCPF